MARRGPYGLHSLLDQASAIPLSNPSGTPVKLQKSPAAANDAPTCGEDSQPNQPTDSTEQGSADRSPTFFGRNLTRGIDVGGPEERSVVMSSSSQRSSAEEESKASGSSATVVDRDWSATWHSRDAEMWHNRMSTRRAQVPSSSLSRWVGRSLSNSFESDEKTFANDSESEWKYLKENRERRESVVAVNTLQGWVAGTAYSTTGPPSMRSLDIRKHPSEKLPEKSVDTMSEKLSGRRSRRHSAGKRPDRPSDFSNKQAMVILGRVSSRTGSSVESGSTSASPEVSSSSSGTSGLLAEELTGGLDSHNNWREWRKELGNAVDEFPRVEKVGTAGPILLRRDRQRMIAGGKAESLRPLDSATGRSEEELSLLRSISLDRGIGEIAQGHLTGQAAKGDTLPVKGKTHISRIFHSESTGHSRGVAGNVSFISDNSTSPSSSSLSVKSESFGSVGLGSPQMDRTHADGERERGRGGGGGGDNIRSPRQLSFDLSQAVELSEDNPGLSASRHMLPGRLSKEAEGSAWVARREEDQMKASLKKLSQWLEVEGVKLVGRMPMSAREMALVMSQVTDGADKQQLSEAEFFSFAKKNILRSNAKTLLEVFERKVATRNNTTCLNHSRQVMMRSLEEAQRLLEGAIASHQMHSKRRINVSQDVLPSVREAAVSRFRGSVGGYLAKGELQRMQEELVTEVDNLAKAMEGSVLPPRPLLR